MCWQVDDSRFDDVIVGEFYNNDGKRVKGIYATVSDDAVVVNINVIDRLLDGVKILDGGSADMTLEQAETKFGDQIIKNYLAKHGVADIFTFDEVDKVYGNDIAKKHAENSNIKAHNACVENQKKASQSNKEKGKSNQALIIKAVLEGSTKKDIEYNLGFSRPTINKALSGLDEQKFEDIWFKYRKTIFAGVDMGLFVDFKLCECNYKKYMERLHFNSEIAFREKVDKINEEIERDKEATAKVEEISQKMVEAGHKPVSAMKGVANSPVTEEDDYFSKVVELAHTPVENTKPIIPRTNIDEDEKFSAKYAEKLKESKTELATSTKTSRFIPRTRAGISFAGYEGTATDDMTEIDGTWEEPAVYQGSYDEY